jgi:phosphoserine aminotransferase
MVVQNQYYFGAGPAVLPDVILHQAAADILDWHHTGLSVLEVGHRTEAFMHLLQAAQSDLRDLLHIPAHYHILFLGGAARAQFATVPLNLITTEKKRAAYICSGLWSELAFEEAKRFSDAYVLTDKTVHADTAYVYYTPNETVNGVRFPEVPTVGDVPLVADMTSNLLSEPIDIEQFGVIFAGAQKNIGPAGLTLVIVRDDLLKRTPAQVVPTMLDYRVHAKHQSLYATPPVFQCAMAAHMFKWIKAEGGVDALYEINQKKAAKLYAYIDASQHYQCAVEASQRSIMNVCFSMTDVTKEAAFLEAAEASGLIGLKGHRVRGGLRASLYNAMPMAGVEALITFMDGFIS